MEDIARPERENPLHEDLTAKVIARFSYPEIIKVNCLSRAWRRFLCGDVSQPDVKAFQREVESVATAWLSFAPVIQFGESYYGYNPIGRLWRNIAKRSAQCSAPLLSTEFLTLRSSDDDRYDEYLGKYEHTVTHFAGSMLSYFRCTRLSSNFGYMAEVKRSILVKNLVTGSSNIFIAPLVTKDGLWWTEGLVFHAHSDGFIIVLLLVNRLKLFLDLAVQILDSREGGWSIVFVQESGCLFSEYTLDGRAKCYSQLVDDSKLIIFARECSRPILGQLDCGTKVWTCSPVPENASFLGRQNANGCRFVLCGSRVIIYSGTHQHGSLKVQVHEYFHISGIVATIEEGYELGVNWDEETVAYSSDEEHIFVAVCKHGSHVHVHSYNVSEREWKQLPHLSSHERFQWVEGTFSPGLNPYCNPALVRN